MIWYIIIIGIIAFFIWCFIEDYREKKRQKIRDHAARVVCEHYNINDEKNNILNKLETCKSDVVGCSSCGRGFLIRRNGKYGEFLGCSRYPMCKHTENL